MDEPEIWTTDDLGIATFLVMQGHEVATVWSGAKCMFEFVIEGELMNEIVDYTGGMASVDPKEFHANVNQRRREMLNDPRRRHAARTH